jgi:LPS export ABC transporter protein LptC
MRQVRWIIVAVLVAVSGSISFFIIWPSEVGISVGSVSVIGTDADLKMDRVHIVQNKQGSKNWEMWADTAEVYRKKNYTKLENIHLRFYPKNGKIMDVTADNGLMENESRNMRLRGNVLIKTQDGVSMRTEALQFRPKEKRIDSDEKIFVSGESFRLTGIGLRGRTDLGQYFLNKNVQAVLYDSTSAGLSSFSNSADASALPGNDVLPTGGNKP